MELVPDKKRFYIVYILLSVNALLTLALIYYEADSIVLIIWSWSIWLMIYYELIDTCNKIYHFVLVSTEKRILCISMFIQSMYVGCYHLFISNIYNKEILICSLIVMQMIKIFIYFNTLSILERENQNVRKVHYNIDQFAELLKVYILYKEERVSIKEKNQQMISMVKITSVLGGIYVGGLLADTIIFYVDKISYKVFLLSLCILGIFYCIYILHGCANMTIKKYLLVSIGMIVSFGVFISDALEGWVQIYYIVVFQIPFIFTIKSIVDNVNSS